MIHEFVERLPTFRDDMLRAVVAVIQHELDSRNPDGPHDENLYVIRQCSDPVAYAMQFPNQKEHFGILSEHTFQALVPFRSKKWAEHLVARRMLLTNGKPRYEVVTIPKKRYFDLPWTDWIDEEYDHEMEQQCLKEHKEGRSRPLQEFIDELKTNMP